jgi:aminopeptidase
MKTSWTLGSALALSLFCGAGNAAGPDTKATAETLVTQCAAIKTGDRVLISGRPADIELLEQVAVNVRKLGAFPLITVSNEKLARRMMDETPAKFDSQIDDLDLKLAGVINAMISVNATDTPGLFADIPPARATARAKARAAVEQAALQNDVRTVALGNGLFPTAATAKMYGLPEEQLSTIFWAGVNTDYSKLQNTGQSLQAALAKGKELKITTPNGTNLTLGIASRQTLVSDGVISADDLAKGGAACQVWLPAGEVFSTPVPGTAEGTVVVDRHFFQGKEITGITLTFKAGKLTAMTAKSGLEPLKAWYDAAGPGKDEFGFYDIGINSDVKVPANSKLQTWIAAGTVTIGHGGNTWAGGANTSEFTVDYRLPNCTVTVDGKAIVENGTLKP